MKALLTCAALATFTRGRYHFCPEPGCDVVYFADEGTCFRQPDVRATAWQKAGTGARTICHCFGETEGMIRRDIERDGHSDAVARVRAHIAAGRCACDIRNPRGACCLGDLIAAVRRISDEVSGSTGSPATS